MVFSERAIEYIAARSVRPCPVSTRKVRAKESSLPVVLEELEDCVLIRLQGECGLASAVELKRLLLEGLAAGKSLRLNMAGLEEIDFAAMQLLWAAGREALRGGAAIDVRLPEPVASALRDAGLEQIPGLTLRSDGCPR
jgi:anti-anti-sigma regulatory factor